MSTEQVSRRCFLETCGKGAAAAALAAALGRRSAFAARKPNIIYIMADDLGYADLSCYGQTRFTTPNIDALATEGIKFSDHYSGSTVCAPTRCVLMTGLHTGHCRIRDNDVGPLAPEDVTVAEVLKSAGYTTGAFGKWGIGENGTTGVPNLQGFDDWFGYLNQSRAHRYYVDYLYKNGVQYPVSKRDYTPDLIFADALRFVRENRDKAFFLYLPVTIPHAGLEVPKDSLKDEIGLGPCLPERNTYWGSESNYVTQPAPHAAFVAMVKRLDRDVGRLMALLQELGIDDDTIVFFVSDNGPHSEGGGDPNFFDSNGALRGKKRDLYEGGIRVPMIARWPGHVPAGATSAEPGAMWDFLHTAAEIAGVAAPSGLDGISFLPALTGDAAGQTPHEYLYWEWQAKRAVRKGSWKGVKLGADPLQLYDLSTDIGEASNVAAANPAVVADLEQIMTDAHT